MWPIERHSAQQVRLLHGRGQIPHAGAQMTFACLSIFSCTLQHKFTIYLMNMGRGSRSGDMSQPTGVIIESPQSGVPIRQRSRSILKATVEIVVEAFTYRQDGKDFCGRRCNRNERPEVGGTGKRKLWRQKARPLGTDL